jgi:hypothetical protein
LTGKIRRVGGSAAQFDWRARGSLPPKAGSQSNPSEPAAP